MRTLCFLLAIVSFPLLAAAQQVVGSGEINTVHRAPPVFDADAKFAPAKAHDSIIIAGVSDDTRKIDLGLAPGAGLKLPSALM